MSMSKMKKPELYELCKTLQEDNKKLQFDMNCLEEENKKKDAIISCYSDNIDRDRMDYNELFDKHKVLKEENQLLLNHLKQNLNCIRKQNEKYRLLKETHTEEINYWNNKQNDFHKVIYGLNQEIIKLKSSLT